MSLFFLSKSKIYSHTHFFAAPYKKRTLKTRDRSTENSQALALSLDKQLQISCYKRIRPICSVATESSSKQTEDRNMDASKEIFLRDYKLHDYYLILGVESYTRRSCQTVLTLALHHEDYCSNIASLS